MNEPRQATATISYIYGHKRYSVTKTFTEECGRSLDTLLLERIESLLRSGAKITEVIRYWN